MTFSIPLFADKQSKTEQYDLAFDAKQVFVKTRVDKRHIGDAVGNEIDLVRHYMIDFFEKFRAALTHHDQSIREGRDILPTPDVAARQARAE